MIFLGRIVISKVFELAVTLFILMAASFLLLKLLPGGPFHEETALHPLVRQNLVEYWQLDQSWTAQFFSYMKALLQGNWGVSLARPDQHVTDIIAQRFSQTFIVSSLSLLVAIVGSLSLTLISMRFRKSWIEVSVEQFALAAISLPSLFWGPFLIYIFGFYLNLLPIALLQNPASYVLPVLTLSFRPMGSMIRLLKQSMEEIFLEDYIRTAEAKGLSQTQVLIKHVLRNSIIPFLAYLGPLSAGLLSGSFLVEILFSIPGLGSEFGQSLAERDYTVILGLTLFYGILLVLINGVCDLAMTWSDPRMRELK